MLEKTAGIIAEELNVKTVEFTSDESELVKRSCKANFKALGSRLGKDMKEAAARIAQFTGAEISDLIAGKTITITLANGNTADITAADLIIQREEKPGMVAASENGVTIALTTELTPELIAEGLARELVSKVQNMRKEMKFEVTDRIELVCVLPEESAGMLSSYKDYIAGEVLAESIAFEGNTDTECDLNGVAVKVAVKLAK